MVSLLPELWLLILIVGLPQLSETVYTPALPDIAQSLHVSESWVEYTLTIYLFGFAVGTLFWGKLSDRFGRKPCMLLGLFVYLLGCIGCFFSGSIHLLMISRFIQAFGGSTGSVLGQAICRDAFHGADRGKVYSTIGSALAFSPAVGPIIGGFLDQMFGWPFIFLFLSGFGFLVLLITAARLPETHLSRSQQTISLFELMTRMATDIRVIAFAFLVAGCNGIGFSYFAEGPFFLIEQLGLSPSLYGSTFLGVAVAGMIGGYISRRLHNSHDSYTILRYGIMTVAFMSTLFAATIWGLHHFSAHSNTVIITTLLCMMGIFAGIGIMIPNALALSLEDYRSAIGSASSLFGFFYYVLISLATLGMGLLHNGTIIPMPFYFCGIGISMWTVFSIFVVNRESN